MPEPSTAPYALVALPGPGLALIADRRDGKTRRWSRTLHGGRPPSGQRAGEPRPCAGCGLPLRGGYYKLLQRAPGNPDRLCLMCVTGDDL